jgi:hypothetical protein
MDQLMVYPFSAGQGQLMKILIYFWWAAKNSWQLHEGHDGEIDGLGSKIGPKPRPGYQMTAHIKGFQLV